MHFGDIAIDQALKFAGYVGCIFGFVFLFALGVLGDFRSAWRALRMWLGVIAMMLAAGGVLALILA